MKTAKRDERVAILGFSDFQKRETEKLFISKRFTFTQVL